MAFRCLVWVGLSGGDGAEVEFAAGQVDHGAEVVHVLESAGSGLDVLDDAVESFEDRVGVGVVEVGEDVPPVAAYLAGNSFMGSSRERVIHEHRRLRAVSASARSALVS